MRPLAAFRSLAAIDARNVARDPMLRWMVVLTPAFGLLLRYALPPAAGWAQERFGLDLMAHAALFMGFLPLVVAGMIGTVVGFLLLDQRDDQTMPALLVTPMSLGDYLRYRMSVLIVLCVVVSGLALQLAGLTETTLQQRAVASIAAAPLAPIYALFLGSFAANKVQGFALAKIMGIVMVPVIAAYFVTGPWQHLFGIVPHYWSLAVFLLFDAGAVGSAWLHALVGLAWQGVVLALLAWRFARVVRR